MRSQNTGIIEVVRLSRPSADRPSKKRPWNRSRPKFKHRYRHITTNSNQVLQYLPYNEHCADAVLEHLSDAGIDITIFPKSPVDGTLKRTVYRDNNLVLTTESCVEDIPKRILTNGHGYKRVEGIVSTEFLLEFLYDHPELGFSELFYDEKRYRDPRHVTEKVMEHGEMELKGKDKTLVLRYLPVDKKYLASFVFLRPEEVPASAYKDVAKTLLRMNESRLKTFSDVTSSIVFSGRNIRTEEVTRNLEGNMRFRVDELERNDPHGIYVVYGSDLYQTGDSARKCRLKIMQNFGEQPLVYVTLKNRHGNKYV